VDGYRAAYDSGSEATGHTIPVVAFKSPNTNNLWIGPEEDFYVETGSGLTGFQMLRSHGITFWCDSMVAGDHVDGSVDGLIAEFERSVTGGQLAEAAYGFRADGEGESSEFRARVEARRVNIDEVIQDVVFGAHPKDSYLRIINIKFSNNMVTLMLSNPEDKLRISVVIDAVSKKLVKGEVEDYADRQFTK
jgi:hypothetical protein